AHDPGGFRSGRGAHQGAGGSTHVRIGTGYDVHRLKAGRDLILGGVRIDHPLGLEGHSDADVLTHAVIDAMLGAAALGDIGEHFADDDPAYAGADSLALLREAATLVSDAGWAVANVDATVLLERPQLGPHRVAMQANLAAAIGIEASRVSVKATRGEGMGFVGRGEGAAALAVATLQA